MIDYDLISSTLRNFGEGKPRINKKEFEQDLENHSTPKKIINTDNCLYFGYGSNLNLKDLKRFEGENFQTRKNPLKRQQIFWMEYFFCLTINYSFQ